MAFDCHRNLQRQSESHMLVRHDNGMQGNKAPLNECLATLLGKETTDSDPCPWRGSLLVSAYRHRLAEFRNPETGKRAEKAFVPLDVDTMALGPVLALLKWRSRVHREYRLGGV